MMKSKAVNDLAAEVEARTLNLIDVREADEFAEGHLPGAINLPLSAFLERYGELDKDKPYHIICRSGARSAQACARRGSRARFNNCSERAATSP